VRVPPHTPTAARARSAARLVSASADLSNWDVGAVCSSDVNCDFSLLGLFDGAAAFNADSDLAEIELARVPPARGARNDRMLAVAGSFRLERGSV
jgi:hypothetical protein